MAYRTASEIGPPVSMQGMGCGCAGLAGCGCSNSGGLGLFDSGVDFTTWGLPEWGIVGIGLYALFSLVGDTKRGARRVRGGVSGAYRGAKSAIQKRNPERRKARR